MNKKIFIKILILLLLFVSGFYFSSKLVVAMPAAPTVSSFSPTDNYTYVASSSNLVIGFSENIFADSGNIYIKKSVDDSVFETIDVTSDQVTISGPTTTIALSSLLERGISYYVQIDSTCFKNAGEDYYAGISATTTWNFNIRNDLYVTELVKDINSGSGDSSLDYFIEMNDEIYFRATDGINGTELWKSDGTENGTVMVKDINEGGNAIGNNSPFIVMNNELYFSADDGINYNELWKSDGTEIGTVMVKHINPTFGSNPKYFVIMNDELYFQAWGDGGRELWKSDGTESGTVMVKNINPSGSSWPTRLTLMNNEIYFHAKDGANGYELWKSDGTENGTVMVKGINPAGDSYPDDFMVMNNEIYFQADDGTNGYELWKSDGIISGTVMVKDISGSGGSFPDSFIVINNEIYFAADNGINSPEPWKSNGTASGTVMIKNIRTIDDGGRGGGGGFSYPIIMSNEVYFQAYGNDGRELWKTDGTESGTIMVKDINETGGSSPDNFVVMNGELYFQADNNTNGSELWKTDGTENGTVMVGDINDGPGGSSPDDLIVMNDELYFSATDGINGKELFKMYIITSPVVVSDSSVSVSQATATISGEIQSIGKQNNYERGFLWSFTNTNPTVDDNQTSLTGSFGTGSFSATISDLNCGTTYYFRAYSINRAGTSYGDSVSFTTEDCPPSIPPDAHKPPKKPKKDKDGEEVDGSFKIIINNGKSKTKERTVNLELIAGSDTVNMAVTEDPEFTYASIELYQRNKEYILSEGEGEKTIYVKFYTKWGQSSKAVSDSINYKKIHKTGEEEQLEPKEETQEQFPNVSEKLSGGIFLQPKDEKRVWYVNPTDEKKYSIDNPLRMFNVMSYLSLGVVHKYIDRYLEFPKRVLGRILLDVEKNGEAYYINPIDKKGYYLGRPQDAFNIFKGFSVEVSDGDIEKIEIGEINN